MAFTVESTPFLLHPPGRTSLPMEELPLRPLFETLCIDNVLLLFTSGTCTARLPPITL